MTKPNIKAKIAALLLALLVCFGAVMGGQGNLSAFAAEDDTIRFEQTNVMDDLENSSVDGKPFDVRDYAFNNQKEAQVLMLAEYCYSFYANLQGNFGLYLYVWNPQGLRFDTLLFEALHACVRGSGLRQVPAGISQPFGAHQLRGAVL